MRGPAAAVVVAAAGRRPDSWPLALVSLLLFAAATSRSETNTTSESSESDVSVLRTALGVSRSIFRLLLPAVSGSRSRSIGVFLPPLPDKPRNGILLEDGGCLLMFVSNDSGGSCLELTKDGVTMSDSSSVRSMTGMAAWLEGPAGLVDMIGRLKS